MCRALGAVVTAGSLYLVLAALSVLTGIVRFI
jgi:hypothetical protein